MLDRNALSKFLIDFAGNKIDEILETYEKILNTVTVPTEGVTKEITVKFNSDDWEKMKVFMKLHNKTSYCAGRDFYFEVSSCGLGQTLDVSCPICKLKHSIISSKDW